MSSTLDMKGKEWYKEKLKPVSLLISNANKFCSDMSQWPKVKYGHIFVYIISRPETYTQEQLPSWKAVRRVQNGHVKIVLSITFSSGNADYLPIFPGYHPCFTGMIGSFLGEVDFCLQQNAPCISTDKVVATQHTPRMAI